MFTISNNILSVKISEKGAELQSIFHLQNNLEYLWSGDEKFWAKKSPVLFPIVGGLKNNTYSFEGKDYKLSRHGFARDHVFQLKEQSESSITLCLASSEQTKALYPFDFLFCVAMTSRILHNLMALCHTVFGSKSQQSVPIHQCKFTTEH